MAWKGWESFVPPGGVPAEASRQATPQQTPKKPSKYHAKRCLVTDLGQALTHEDLEALALKGFGIPTGIWFDSKREAEYWLRLEGRRRAGQIRDLERQIVFPLYVTAPDGTLVKVATWRADFRYIEVATGQRVVADAKGFSTPLYRRSKKMFEAQYGIPIVEV